MWFVQLYYTILQVCGAIRGRGDENEMGGKIYFNASPFPRNCIHSQNISDGNNMRWEEK